VAFFNSLPDCRREANPFALGSWVQFPLSSIFGEHLSAFRWHIADIRHLPIAATRYPNRTTAAR
jgi:hypothetical protein